MILFSLSAQASSTCENQLIQNNISYLPYYLESENFNADGIFRFRALMRGEFPLEKLFAWRNSAEERGVSVGSIAFYGSRSRSLHLFFDLTGDHRRYMEVISDLGAIRVQWFQKLPSPPAITYEENIEILRKPLLELALSNRTLNCLRRSRMHFVADLLPRSEAELLQIPGMGIHIISDIKATFTKMNLQLGTPVVNWPPPDLARYPLTTLSQAVLARVLIQPIENLSLGNRINNQLHKAGVKRIGDLVTVPIRRVCYLGFKSVKRIDAELAKIGLSRDLKINGWPPTTECPPAIAKASE